MPRMQLLQEKEMVYSYMDNYDKMKEFFAINLDAFIIAASLKYFGMDNIDSQPTINSFESALKSATKTDKRQWLHKQVSNMLDKFNGWCK